MPRTWLGAMIDRSQSGLLCSAARTFEASMSGTEWYISFAIPGGTKMSIAVDRAAAIESALAMLGSGIDVREVGPMVEPPEGKIIDAAAIRAMRQTREAA